jgi:hypothetical protein
MKKPNDIIMAMAPVIASLPPGAHKEILTGLLGELEQSLEAVVTEVHAILNGTRLN